MSTLVKFRLPGEELGLDFMDYKAGFAKGTLRSIFNAWVAASVIDHRGLVWVKASRLHTILRTNKANARYLLGQASRRDLVEMNEDTLFGGSRAYETLIRSTKVCEWVNQGIQGPSGASKAGYLRYSEAVYQKVRDCELVKDLRAEYGDRLKSARRSLKKKRMKRLKVKHDELTGKLLESSAEFAHIRSASLYFELADQDWNGIIVNSSVHRLLTEAELLDESALLAFCRKKKWSIDWEPTFRDKLHVFEMTGLVA